MPYFLKFYFYCKLKNFNIYVYGVQNEVMSYVYNMEWLSQAGEHIHHLKHPFLLFNWNVAPFDQQALFPLFPRLQ
jgi:hypothetical protein